MSVTALVTGATRGIGRGIAERLAADGLTVAVHYGSDDAAARDTVAAIEKAGGRAFAVRAALGVHGDAAELFAAFDAALAERGIEPGLGVLVNNVGKAGPGEIENSDAEGFDRVFALNVRAPYFIAQEALKRMGEGGRIVNISSGAGILPWPQDPAYAMTKGALDTFTRTLAKHVGPRGITVNSVGPGVIDTESNAFWLDAEGGREAGGAWSVFKRVGTVQDVADVVSFLASENSRWVTGSWLDATGGSLL
ncbi:short-chain dehydrogenase [Actinorhabdospora filicis]|uniref:Short-chain dehydrogenase n=1 Tax=Actinorhabdospora filicis TaxID=1785913 RepID=A0A9W6SRW3_9ACTN|nr:SDR family oxidoreductase [Actinorhabdospora filicis]GLZ80844.1 short-chain dehydrogenase [Actinorhabdospora filicis]